MTLASLLTVDQTLLEAVVYRIPFYLETLHQKALLHQEFPDWKPIAIIRDDNLIPLKWPMHG